MYVCVCKAVNDAQIRAAVDDGARTLRDLSRMLEVATQCGRCAPAAREQLSLALAERECEALPLPLSALAACAAAG